MARAALPVGLVAAAALADGAGLHGFAFYALLAAVPATAAAALLAYGDLLEPAREHSAPPCARLRPARPHRPSRGLR